MINIKDHDEDEEIAVNLDDLSIYHWLFVFDMQCTEEIAGTSRSAWWSKVDQEEHWEEVEKGELHLNIMNLIKENQS